jgi:L-ribulokinase
VPQGDVTSLGSAIFAFLAARGFASIEQAQTALCPRYRVFKPDPAAVTIYDEMFRMYKRLYFALGAKKSEAVTIGDVLPRLRQIAAQVRNAQWS